MLKKRNISQDVAIEKVCRRNGFTYNADSNKNVEIIIKGKDGIIKKVDSAYDEKILKSKIELSSHCVKVQVTPTPVVNPSVVARQVAGTLPNNSRRRKKKMSPVTRKKYN